MTGNNNLHQSRFNPKDEFYTGFDLVHFELSNYLHHFDGKRVYCNCDDPDRSNFVKYLNGAFSACNLKGLVATCHSFDGCGTKAVFTADDKVVSKLHGDGDFRSDECLRLLDESDVVVTNPPFSLLREFIHTLVSHGKKFLVLGSLNTAPCRDIFPLIQGGQMWLGCFSGHAWFRVPDDYEPKATDFKVDPEGRKYRRIGNICWYTNLEHEGRHEFLKLVKKYSPDAYRRYDEYDAIDVRKVEDIPYGYGGKMGVPITYLTKHCPEQFDIIGLDRYVDDNPHPGYRFKLGGKETYARLLIKRR